MGDTLIDSGRGDPTRSNHRWERHEVEVTLDANGDASTTLTYDEAYRDGSTVTAHVTGTSAGDYYASAEGGTQATIEVAGGPADTTVTANVLVIGDQPL